MRQLDGADCGTSNLEQHVLTGWNEMSDTAFWVALLKIIWINILHIQRRGFET
jgi:hypothetical protein